MADMERISAARAQSVVDFLFRERSTWDMDLT